MDDFLSEQLEAFIVDNALGPREARALRQEEVDIVRTIIIEGALGDDADSGTLLRFRVQQAKELRRLRPKINEFVQRLVLNDEAAAALGSCSARVVTTILGLRFGKGIEDKNAEVISKIMRFKREEILGEAKTQDADVDAEALLEDCSEIDEKVKVVVRGLPKEVLRRLVLLGPYRGTDALSKAIKDAKRDEQDAKTSVDRLGLFEFCKANELDVKTQEVLFAESEPVQHYIINQGKIPGWWAEERNENCLAMVTQFKDERIVGKSSRKFVDLETFMEKSKLNEDAKRLLISQKDITVIQTILREGILKGESDDTSATLLARLRQLNPEMTAKGKGKKGKQGAPKGKGKGKKDDEYLTDGERLLKNDIADIVGLAWDFSVSNADFEAAVNRASETRHAARVELGLAWAKETKSAAGADDWEEIDVEDEPERKAPVVVLPPVDEEFPEEWLALPEPKKKKLKAKA